MSNKNNDDIMERLYEQAESFVDDKIKLNPTIPLEARQQLIEEEYRSLIKNYSDVDPESPEEEMDDDSGEDEL